MLAMKIFNHSLLCLLLIHFPSFFLDALTGTIFSDRIAALLLRQFDFLSVPVASLTALFKHIETIDEQMSDDNLRERTLVFIKDKVIRSTYSLRKLLICPFISLMYSNWLYDFVYRYFL